MYFLSLDLSDDAITAQSFIFFLAGFDAQANSMCHMAYEIAINGDVQKRLQEEIDEVSEKCQGTLTYEVLMAMRYMDMVVSGRYTVFNVRFLLFKLMPSNLTIDHIKFLKKYLYACLYLN